MTTFTLPARPPHKLASRALLAVAVSVGVNAAVVWFLVTLYIRPAPMRQVISPMHVVWLPPARTIDEPEDKPVEPLPTEAQPMTVKLDAMAPQVAPPRITLSPVNVPPPLIGVSLPTLDVPVVRVPVAVASEPKQHTGQPSGNGKSGEAAAGNSAGVDEPPRELTNNVSPLYPDTQRRLGIEADVTVKMLVDERGRVIDAQIVQGRAGFDASVLNAVRRWRFDPAKRDGQPVKVWAVKVVHFRLED